MMHVMEIIKMIFIKQTRREAHADALVAVVTQKRQEAGDAINQLLTEITSTKNQKRERAADDKRYDDQL